MGKRVLMVFDLGCGKLPMQPYQQQLLSQRRKKSG
jgi:uncharacterized protein (AIM24 family)